MNGSRLQKTERASRAPARERTARAEGAPAVAPALRVGSASGPDVLALQRSAGNAAVVRVLQRVNGTGTAAALDPKWTEAHTDLGEICDRGKDVAWALYRTVVQLEEDAAGEITVADERLRARVTAAATARRNALADFDRLHQEGAQHWNAAQKEVGKAHRDILALNDHLLALVEGVDAASAMIAAIAERAWRQALEAEEGGHLVAARHAFKAADIAEAVLGTRRPQITLSGRKASSDWREVAYQGVYGWGLDTAANTISGATYGNVVSGISLDAGSGSTLANLGTATGAVLSPLAVLCGSVDLVLGVVGAIKTGRRIDELEGLQSRLADPHARVAGRYALEQKQRKRKHRIWSSVVAGAGLAAGIAGVVALGVSTFGVGALAIGVVGAVLGLGTLGLRIYRKSKWGRRRKMKGFAKAMIDTAADPQADLADRDNARYAIRTYGAAPASGDFAATDVAVLTDALLRQALSQRDLAAKGLLELLVNGSRSERRDAGLVLEGLKLRPETLVELAERGRGPEAHGQIAAKLASW